MAAPVIPIVLGVLIVAAALSPKKASAAPVAKPPVKVPPPVPGTTPPGGLPPGATLPGGFAWPYGSPGAAGCPPTTTPNTGIAGLPSPGLRETVQTAMVSPFSTADSLEAVANQLDFCGLSVAASEVRARANALRAASGGTGGGPTPGTTPGTEPTITDTPPTGPKVQGDPNTQWNYTVVEGDNPSLIARKVFGSDTARAPDGRFRWVELVQYNTSKPTVGNAANPYGTAPSLTDLTGTPGYNFATLVAGEKIKVPKSWNPWVSSDGFAKGTAEPWPTAGGAVAGWYGGAGVGAHGGGGHGGGGHFGGGGFAGHPFYGRGGYGPYAYNWQYPAPYVVEAPLNATNVAGTFTDPNGATWVVTNTLSPSGPVWLARTTAYGGQSIMRATREALSSAVAQYANSVAPARVGRAA